MPQGKVKWFNNAKGFGFIIADEGNGELCNEDLFAHFSSIQMEGYKTLKAGQSVQFDTQPSDKGVHAVNIAPLDMPEDSQFTPVDSSNSDNQQDAPPKNLNTADNVTQLRAEAANA